MATAQAETGHRRRGSRGQGALRRSIRLSLDVTERDALDVDAIARAWDVPMGRAAYYLLAGRLAELREERPEASAVECASRWLADQGRKIGHAGWRPREGDDGQAER